MIPVPTGGFVGGRDLDLARGLVRFVGVTKEKMADKTVVSRLVEARVNFPRRFLRRVLHSV
jgi:hypothetical protein